jgi:hypothetical protein
VSATNRGAERREDDFYATPRWCVERLLEAWPPAHWHRVGGLWLEPACGDGRLILAVNEILALRELPLPDWRAVDIRPEAVRACRQLGVEAYQGDYARFSLAPAIRNAQFDVILTNPPFVDAFPFVKLAVTQARAVCLLLRLNWLASAERARWLHYNAPSIYVLPDRPDFTGEGGDATEYAWMVWDDPAEGERPCGEVHILQTTPLEERRIAA